MIKFNKPVNLNGSELLNELKADGVEIDKVPFLDAENNLWLDIAEADKAKAQMVVDNHNGTIVPAEPSVAEKLASVGLSLDDLKTALGI